MVRHPAHAPLNVYLNARLVGQLHRGSSGAIDFQYDAAWLAWDDAIPVSVSLPLREDRYIGNPVLAVFENLLPDKDDIRRRVAERSQAGGSEAYSLLIVGRHFVQTAKSAGLADKMAADVTAELGDTAAKNIDDALAALPKGFPEKIATSITDGAKRRLKALTLPDGEG